MSFQLPIFVTDKLTFTTETPQRTEKTMPNFKSEISNLQFSVSPSCSLRLCDELPVAARSTSNFTKHLALTLLACIVLAPCATQSRAATAHKFYASLAQLDYNAETKSLEVSLRIFADDIELALTRRAGRAIYLDKTLNVGKLMTAYLQERFEVRGRDGKTKEVKWVGMESKVDSTWLYFEIPISEGLNGAQLRNRVLLEQHIEQVNTTILKVNGKQRDFIFKTGDDDWKPLAETMNAER